MVGNGNIHYLVRYVLNTELTMASFGGDLVVQVAAAIYDCLYLCRVVGRAYTGMTFESVRKRGTQQI
jgi:hypothetical protein